MIVGKTIREEVRQQPVSCVMTWLEVDNSQHTFDPAKYAEHLSPISTTDASTMSKLNIFEPRMFETIRSIRPMAKPN